MNRLLLISPRVPAFNQFFLVKKLNNKIWLKSQKLDFYDNTLVILLLSSTQREPTFF